MHILIAPNAFKNSLSASEAANAIRQGLESSQLKCTTECFPIADGGDGTAHLLVEKFQGHTISIEVSDPLGRTITAPYGVIDQGETAVIELADASGIRLFSEHELNPMEANSFGTGQMIAAALDCGVKKIIIGLGGSATVDGGVGILSALGVRFFDSGGRQLKPVPADLGELWDIDISGLDERVYNCEIIALCDVDNCLLGDRGAAVVFGPQKGAKGADIEKLEAILQKISEIAFKMGLGRMDTIKRGGAAGGSAAALATFLKAELVDGAHHYLSITCFEDALRKCKLLITGEGSLDKQTLQGKAPFAVASAAKKMGIPVLGIAGRIPLEDVDLMADYFQVVLSLANEPTDIDLAIKNTRLNLVRTATAVGNLFSLRQFI